MSVKSVAPATIISPAPKMPEASTVAKVSKFVQDDKFPDSQMLKKPTRNMTVHHLTTIEETDEPVQRPAAPKNFTPPVMKPPKEDFRRVALLNKAMGSDNSK